MTAAPLTEAERAAVERGKLLSLNIEVSRARMRGSAHAIIGQVGFAAFMAGWQRDLISIAEAARAAGFDLSGWSSASQPETSSTSNRGSC